MVWDPYQHTNTWYACIPVGINQRERGTDDDDDDNVIAEQLELYISEQIVWHACDCCYLVHSLSFSLCKLIQGHWYNVCSLGLGSVSVY